MLVEILQRILVVDDEKSFEKWRIVLLAPLHNPANAAGIRAFREICPNITSVVVLNHAVESLMLPSSKYYTENKVRKYGAHGTSHRM